VRSTNSAATRSRSLPLLTERALAFKDRPESPAPTDVKAAGRSVSGQGSDTSWHYLLILAGVDDVKADRMICRFVARAGGVETVTPTEAYDAVVGAHRILVLEAPDLTLRALNHAIWGAERARRR